MTKLVSSHDKPPNSDKAPARGTTSLSPVAGPASWRRQIAAHFDIDAKSIGLNIRLPAEQTPNRYITPELCFQFHYFALRKLHFLLRALALVVFPADSGRLTSYSMP